jgi:HEAT repeats
MAAPPPRLVHARVASRPAVAGMDKVVRAWAAAQTEPAWLGYEVPAVAGHHEMCCFDSFDGVAVGGGGCRIEQHGSFGTRGSGERLDSLDEGTAIVLLRAEQGHVERLRVLSRGCGIDAGDRALTWVEGVSPSESIGLLAALVGTGDADTGHDSVSDGALMAIAVHAGPGADDALERFVDPSRPVRIRKQAAFWMGNMRGRRGYESLARLTRKDPSDDVRAHAVFALGQSEVPEAVDEMIRVAREDASARVRGQALFWLAQKAGRKATAALGRAIEEDPETEVKKKAVFAVSQLPPGDGVPLLIGLARTNHNRDVRKQAMFWLGQSGDPRALAFFQEVLGR